MRNLYIYISNFYLKIKFKKNVINQIDNNYIQKVKISIVDFHRKFKLMNHDQLDNEIEYLLNAFNLQVIKDFKKYPEFFELKKGNKTELLRPAYVDDNETVFLKGIVEIFEEEE